MFKKPLTPDTLRATAHRFSTGTRLRLSAPASQALAQCRGLGLPGYLVAASGADRVRPARYEDWWQALDWVRDGLVASRMLREVEVTAAMPKARPWLARSSPAL